MRNFWAIIFGATLLAGCATFQPQPVSPEKTADAFDTRSLSGDNLRGFLETNHVTGNWPRDSWDLNALTLAAFYYQPALAEARAQWAAVEATKITAGERPIPTLASIPNCECSNGLGGSGVQKDTKTDTNFPIRRKPE